MGFEESRLPSIVWVGLIQSGEGLKRTKTDVPEQGVLPADCLWTQTATLPWVSHLLANSADLGLASLHNCKSQFLKPLSPCTYERSVLFEGLA